MSASRSPLDSSAPSPEEDTPPPPGGEVVLRSTRWSALGRGGVQALRFGTQILLTRLLASPDDPKHAAAVIGVVALALFFREIVDMFCDFGIGQVVVQRKEISDGLLSTLFTINLALGGVLAAGVALAAPIAGSFFENPELTPVLRVLAIGFAFSASTLVHRGLLRRRMAFERVARIDLAEALVVGITSISLVLAGLEVWALVWGALAGTAVATVMCWRATGWRPRLAFDMGHARSVSSFVLNLTGSNLLGFLLSNLDRPVAGRLGQVAMGHYDWILRLVLYPVRTITTVLLSVMTAAFSRIQDDLPRLREQYLRAVVSIAVLTFPLMVGLAVLAEPLVVTGLGSDWAVIAPHVTFMAPVGAIQSLTLSGISLYIARGRTDLMLRWGAVSGISLATAYLIGASHGLGGLARAYTLVIVILALPSFWIPFRLIELPLRTFFSRLVPVLRASILCGLAAWLGRRGLEGLSLPSPIVLAGGTLAGSCAYGVTLWLRPFGAVDDLLRVLRLPPDHALRRRFAAAQEASG